MSLIQLVAIGAQNTSYNIPRNLAVEYFTDEFQENSCILSRDYSDTKIPEYLEIELSQNANIENFETICHKICFELEIGGQKILTIPLRFMIYLKNYEICDNKFYISIPFDIFCNEIKLIALHYHEVRFRLINTENNFTSCKLISKGIYYDQNIRISMARNDHSEIIQQLTSTELNSINPRNEFYYRIPFNGIHKGFYIECENVDEINEISLKLHSQDRFIYNRFLIRRKCIKIHQKLIYLPLNFDKSQQDRTREGFEGSLNLSRIDMAKFNIKLDNVHSRICIYGLGSNILRYSSGMAGFTFSYYSSHDYEEYNEAGNYTTHQQNNYVNFITDVSSNIIYKPITNNNKLTCCISQEDISLNTRYMCCVQCNNNYIEEFIKSWFSQRPHNKKCPMCRENWSDFNIYINSDSPELEVLDPPITS